MAAAILSSLTLKIKSSSLPCDMDFWKWLSYLEEYSTCHPMKKEKTATNWSQNKNKRTKTTLQFSPALNYCAASRRLCGGTTGIRTGPPFWTREWPSGRKSPRWKKGGEGADGRKEPSSAHPPGWSGCRTKTARRCWAIRRCSQHQTPKRVKKGKP